MKTALITGITGQDGSYLAKFLLEKGYKVYGVYRRTSTPNFWRLQTLDVLDKVSLIPADLIDMSSMLEAINVSNPDEIYNLAAQSYVGASFDQPIVTTYVDGIGILQILEVLRNTKKKIKFYQASTSELYGEGLNEDKKQNEQTKFLPNSPYANAKLYGFHSVRIYRDSYGLFACNGILFNHESPLRGLEFVTRKITNAVAQIKLGRKIKLRLGNLQAKRDWGFAGDYVEAMWLVLQQEKPDDYVIATDEVHTVQEFVEEAFSLVGLNWKDHVEVDESLQRPNDVEYLRGDCSKAKKVLKWEAKIKFKELVKLMVQEDMSRWTDHNLGKTFPWDALNYPDNLNIVQRKGK